MSRLYLTSGRGVKANNERLSGEDICVIGALRLDLRILILLLHLQHIVSVEMMRAQTVT